MAITVRSVGSRSTSPGAPSGNAAYDVIAMIVSGQINTASTVPAISGFTLGALGLSGATTGRYTAMLWKRIVTPDAGSYTVTAPSGGTVAMAEALALVGVKRTGTPLAAAGNTAGAGTSSSALSPAITLAANAGDFLLHAFGTGGVSVTIPGASNVGWTEQSPTASSILHELSQIAAGNVTALQMTANIATTNRSAVLGAFTPEPVSQNTGLLGLLAA